jgi:hypothetical protein
MDAGISTRSPRTIAPRRLRAHALGLVGANLAIGALVVWAVPIISRLRQGSGGAWSAAQFLQPWARADSGVTALSLLGAVMLVSALIAGLALIGCAARRIRRESAD